MEIILSLISYNFYFSKKLQNLTNSTSTLCFWEILLCSSPLDIKVHTVWPTKSVIVFGSSCNHFLLLFQHFELAKSDLPLLKGLTFWANVLWTQMITNHFSAASWNYLQNITIITRYSGTHYCFFTIVMPVLE